jgi:hypothetical protein
VEVRYQARFTDMTGNKTTIKPEYLLLVHTWF